MKAVTRILFLDEDDQKFFGEGPCRLLRGVQETGSLRAASMQMGMSYTKALKLLKNAENALRFRLTMRAAGGKDGGGSCLTPEGEAWLQKYEAYRDACVQANQKLYREYFPEQPLSRYGNTGCVIMASGFSKRFGGNKLTTDFHGEPMIMRILSATQGIFARRVVVTRHAEIAEICNACGVDVLLHDLPYRSDTVRLGLEAVGDVDGCMFCAADQPLLRRETVTLLAESAAQDRNSIWRPCCGETPGSPVVFPRWAFEQLMNLPEGKGGGYIARMYPERVRTVAVSDEYELMDADDRETLALLLKMDSQTERLSE